MADHQVSPIQYIIQDNVQRIVFSFDLPLMSLEPEAHFKKLID